VTGASEAATVLRRGGLVAFPTETVYGLGADATNASAVRRLFAVKGRPPDHPVIVHVGANANIDEWADDAGDSARALARACWPGPLTVVVRKRSGIVVDEVTGGRATVGLRVPSHPLALELLDAFGGAVAAPSANRFGRVSPTTAQHVRDDLGDDVDLVLDGGPSTVGIESTIVDCTGDVPAILRVGGVTRDAVERIVGAPVELRTRGEVAAPGTLASHYAPNARVELVERDDVVERAAELTGTRTRVAVLALEGDLPGTTEQERFVVLAPPRDVDEYARFVYQRLRDADASGMDVVLVVPPPDEGIGAAVRDRLARAARGYGSRR
jgi:L-threonylcarbamoyladenylate synthase